MRTELDHMCCAAATAPEPRRSHGLCGCSKLLTLGAELKSRGSVTHTRCSDKQCVPHVTHALFFGLVCMEGHPALLCFNALLRVSMRYLFVGPLQDLIL